MEWNLHRCSLEYLGSKMYGHKNTSHTFLNIFSQTSKSQTPAIISLFFKLYVRTYHDSANKQASSIKTYKSFSWVSVSPKTFMIILFYSYATLVCVPNIHKMLFSQLLFYVSVNRFRFLRPLNYQSLIWPHTLIKFCCYPRWIHLEIYYT